MACLASPEQLPIYAEVNSSDSKLLTPGGSALNSARAYKHANPGGSVAYFGCIGNDEFGKSLSEQVAKSGVDAKFSISDEVATGTCAVLVGGAERTLCANISAAKAYPLKHLEDNMSVLENAEIIYTTGFFVDSNFEAVKKICDFAHEKGKKLAFNLSAVFVIDFYADQVAHVLKYADYVFCNEDEISAYAKSKGFEHHEYDRAARNIAQSEKMNQTPRKVVVTLGSSATKLVIQGMDGDMP
jgi:adenosine kinase